MEAGKGRGNIVLTKQNIDGQDYIRIDYANNQTISLLLSSFHAYIDSNRVHVHMLRHSFATHLLNGTGNRPKNHTGVVRS